MDAKLIRHQQKKHFAGLAMTGIAMIALPVFPVLGSDNGSARITQHMEPLSTAERAGHLEESMQESPALRSNHSVVNLINNQNDETSLGNVTQARPGQHYTGNIAWLYQNGHHNNADIIQSGSNHIGIIHQEGDKLSASINQAGNGFGAAIYQAGLSAEAIVNQFGSASQGISVEQFSRSSAGMTVTIETR